MEAATNSPTLHPADVPAPVLVQAMHTQTDRLQDVSALLQAIADRLELHASPGADDDTHHTLRLALIARDQVEGVIAAFDPYI
jgi:hypothetical protein